MQFADDFQLPFRQNFGFEFRDVYAAGYLLGNSSAIASDHHNTQPLRHKFVHNAGQSVFERIPSTQPAGKFSINDGVDGGFPRR